MGSSLCEEGLVMVDDIKTFYKYYKLYKKGRNEMDKIKEFISSHQNEILIGLGCLMSYQFGFKRGFRNGMRFENALHSLASKGGKS